MKSATKEQQISKESAAEIADHLSAVLNHPDTPKELYQDISMRVCDMTNMSPLSSATHLDEPAHLTKVLLAFGGNFEAVEELYAEPTGDSVILRSTLKSKFPASAVRTAYGKDFAEAKEHLDVLIDESEHEDYFLNALISLFGVIYKQPNLDKEDLLMNLQDYVFAHTMAFDNSADAYVVKVTNSPRTARSEPEAGSNPEAAEAEDTAD